MHNVFYHLFLLLFDTFIVVKNMSTSHEKEKQCLIKSVTLQEQDYIL